MHTEGAFVSVYVCAHICVWGKKKQLQLFIKLKWHIIGKESKVWQVSHWEPAHQMCVWVNSVLVRDADEATLGTRPDALSIAALARKIYPLQWGHPSMGFGVHVCTAQESTVVCSSLSTCYSGHYSIWDNTCGYMKLLKTKLYLNIDFSKYFPHANCV